MSGTGRVGRRKKKEKKKKIQLSLYVNGIAYKFGKNCTFCEKEKAVFYCPECEDFYCTPCDKTAHSHKKRLTHVRTTLSLYSMEDAAFICTRAMRYLKCLKGLQRRVRKVIQRHFDKESLCHYYYNTLNHQTSWSKPSLLRREELRPFLTPVEAASIMTGMYRQYLGRKKANAEILKQYERLFDRHRMELYYAYIGKSELLVRQSWRQPRLMDRRGYHGSISIVWTDDVAATYIQRKWRAIMMREFTKAILRVTYKREWDPVRSDWKYVNRDDGSEMYHKPHTLRNDLWDVNEVSDWTVGHVCRFLRKHGLKQYVKNMETFKVDGKTLLLLDEPDFSTINITNRIHIIKIKVEIDRIYPPWMRESINSLHLIRREKLKRQQELEAAALVLQRVYRGHVGRCDVANMKETNRLVAEKELLDRELYNNSVWWLESVKHGPPAKAYESPSQHIGTVEPPPKYELPPLRTFGRKRTHISAKGLGAINTRGNFERIESEKYTENHITNVYTHKLSFYGYDKRIKAQRQGWRHLIFKEGKNDNTINTDRVRDET